MLTDVDVRRAIEFESQGHSVLSIYLNVDPHRRTPEKYKLALRGLLQQAKDAAAADIKKVQDYVELGYNWQGRGLIMFSCAAENFWWAHSMLVPVEDTVFTSFRPYVHQLATLLDTYDRIGVILVDQMGGRLYSYRMGHLEAAEGFLGDEVKTHRAGGWAAQRYQRHEAETARQNLQEAAELAEEFYRRIGSRALILAGTEKNVARFRDLLSNRLRGMVIGQITADANVTASELQEKAMDLARKQAAINAEEMATAIVTAAHKGSNAVLGLAETLNAVQGGRAQHVVVLAGYSQPAHRYVDTGFIVLDTETDLGLSGKIQALPDGVDSVLRHALLQGVDVSVLDQHEGLAKAGKIGALTRY